jgi:hypothetical protein
LLGAAGLGAGGVAWQGVPGQPLAAGAGPIDTNVLHAKDFGAVGDGQSDDTDALVALFAEMQAQGKPGLLGGHGSETRYLVRPGEWRWTFTNDPPTPAPGPAGPTLWTAGKVVIVGKEGGLDAPLLSIHNDPRAGSRCVHSGYVGGLWFEDRGQGPNRHGLFLYGVEFMRFGPMFSSQLSGDLIHIGRMGGVHTADAWHVSSCIFEGATTWGTRGWTFNNDSVSQVFNFNQIVSLWNMGGLKGLFRGPGAGNKIFAASCHQSRGWALDLSSETGATQGFFLGGAELDAPEYGIRIHQLQFAQLHNIRISHRSGEDAIPGTTSWPRETLRFGGTARASPTSDIEVTLQHRVSSTTINQTTRHLLGSFSEFSDDPTVYNVVVDHHFNPVVPFTPIRSGFGREINPSSRGNLLSLNGNVIHDSRRKQIVRAHADTGVVPSAGYLLPTSKIPFNVANIDDDNRFAPERSEYVAPYAGSYRIRAQIRFRARPGSVRLAIVVSRGGHNLPIAEAVSDVTTESERTFAVECLDHLEAGDRVWISASQSASGPPAQLATGAGAVLNNRFEIAAL